MGADTLTTEQTDQALLERFVRQRDGEAFAELVRRHGPMVRASCIRHLGDTPDADDAFQAAFMVLVRRAAAIRQRDLLGPWLHTVAVRAARKALLLRERRHNRERPVTHMPEPSQEPEPPRDWVPHLDAAVQSLPRKYRLPLILCELEGLCRTVAAQKLDLPLGTLSSRLARGRELLRQRLRRRGVPVSAGVLGVALTTGAAASLPPALFGSTTQAAMGGTLTAPVAAITQGVLHTMFISKVKLVACLVLAVSMFFAGAGWLTWHLVAQTPAAQGPSAKNDRDLLQGKWTVVSARQNGKDVNADEEAAIKDKPFVFKGDKVTAKGECDYSINPSKSPKEMDIVPTEGPEGEKGMKFRAIYELKGDSLKIAFTGPGMDRPRAFDEMGAMVLVLTRAPNKK
jgi:RNA polymerase sigma factor (sigma-70 family)